MADPPAPLQFYRPHRRIYFLKAVSIIKRFRCGPTRPKAVNQHSTLDPICSSDWSQEFGSHRSADAIWLSTLPRHSYRTPTIAAAHSASSIVPDESVSPAPTALHLVGYKRRPLSTLPLDLRSSASRRHPRNTARIGERIHRQVAFYQSRLSQ